MPAPNPYRAFYEAQRERIDRERLIVNDVSMIVSEWVSGEVARHYFGTAADSLDALFLTAQWADQMALVLTEHVDAALDEGFTWDAIAAALGVSRQAATKRFKDGVPPPGGRPRRPSSATGRPPDLL